MNINQIPLSYQKQISIGKLQEICIEMFGKDEYVKSRKVRKFIIDLLNECDT